MPSETELEQLKYPTGRFSPREGLSRAEIDALVDDVAALPRDFRITVAPLSPEQLDTPYRPDGWTVRQVVHHVPDGHVNGYLRFKFALTTEQPAIMAYDEAAWAELADARGEDVEGSLLLLEAIHRRWTHLLRSLEPKDLARTFRHPKTGLVTLEQALQLYAWHGRHHLAQVTGLIERSRW